VDRNKREERNGMGTMKWGHLSNEGLVHSMEMVKVPGVRLQKQL
jgi:hypothetical protein